MSKELNKEIAQEIRDVAEILTDEVRSDLQYDINAVRAKANRNIIYSVILTLVVAAGLYAGYRAGENTLASYAEWKQGIFDAGVAKGKEGRIVVYSVDDSGVATAVVSGYQVEGASVCGYKTDIENHVTAVLLCAKELQNCIPQLLMAPAPWSTILAPLQLTEYMAGLHSPSRTSAIYSQQELCAGA